MTPPTARAAVVMGALSLVGCAYYNGVYNARRADRAGERALAALEDTAAARRFADAAAAAETVLSRYPDSRWRGEALYLAGRGLAFAGECGRALARLDAARERPLDLARRDRALLASGWCLTLQSRHTEALALVEPLRRAADGDVARIATRIAARARLGLGDAAGAARALAAVDPDAGVWLLARDAVDRGLAARAESLLAGPVASGHLRRELVTLVESLWLRDTATAWRLARGALASRGPGDVKASVRLAVGELLAADGRDADARMVLASVARAPLPDSAGPARARDIVVRGALREVRTIAEAEMRLRASSDGRAAAGRVDLALLLARLLAATDTGSGAGRFLAAEVARDSLGALPLARSLFTAVPATSPLAAKAWVAAAAIAGDSAPAYAERARARWPESPYVRALEGREGGDSAAFLADTLLRVTWQRVMTTFADSVAARRAAALIAPQQP